MFYADLCDSVCVQMVCTSGSIHNSGLWRVKLYLTANDCLWCCFECAPTQQFLKMYIVVLQHKTMDEL